jgi:5-methylthioadenosine/S-adenosylhomocysteine deaminase
MSVSRRHFMATGTAALAGAVASSCATPAAQQRAGRILLTGGCVLSLDSRVGDFDVADVLIDGSRIAAVGPRLSATGAQTIDATNCIVMPGFVDTHRHMWAGRTEEHPAEWAARRLQP